jgi:hypothetical protein
MQASPREGGGGARLAPSMAPANYSVAKKSKRGVATTPADDPPRAEIVTLCVATLVIVGGAVGLVFSSGRRPILGVVGGLGVVGALCLVWQLRGPRRR